MQTKRAALRAAFLVSVLLSANAWTHTPRVSADPAAVVVQLSGAVEVQRGGQGKGVPATIGVGLNAGDKVVVPSGGKAVLMYKSGKIESASASLTVAAPESRDPAGRFQQVVTTVAQVATTNARVQPNRQGMIRPVAGEPIPISPRNSVKVLDVRPTLSWYSVPEATSYTVQVRRISPAGGAIQRFTVGKDTSWVYPASAAPLVPGAEYEWTVGATPGRISSYRGRFRIVSAEEFAQVAGVLRELATANIDPMSDGLFVLALAYRDSGMFYEAGRALDRLAELGGGKGRAFHMLRGEVLDAIGDLDGASRAFAAADAEPATQ
jgi:hypothetical protein